MTSTTTWERGTRFWVGELELRGRARSAAASPCGAWDWADQPLKCAGGGARRPGLHGPACQFTARQIAESESRCTPHVTLVVTIQALMTKGTSSRQRFKQGQFTTDLTASELLRERPYRRAERRLAARPDALPIALEALLSRRKLQHELLQGPDQAEMRRVVSPSRKPNALFLSSFWPIRGPGTLTAQAAAV
jgi:hypothetical protein